MSEVATLALPVAHEVTTHSIAHAPADAAVAQSFTFSAQRWKSGLVQGAGGLGLLGMGAFLLSQISSTPGLAAQLAILGSVCSVGGLAMLLKSIRDFFGRLNIDETGIAVRPGFAGYSVAWSELTRWDVKLDEDQHPEAHSLRFWTTNSPCAMFVPNSWLSDHDRAQVRRALLAHAPDKAMQPKRSFGQ